MKRVAIAMCCAAVCSITAFAQTPAADKGTKEATLTGCLAEGTGGHYTLTNAVMGAADAKADAKAKPEAKAAMSYQLMGGDLKGHVGHKVTVTGTMDAAGMAKAAPAEKGKPEPPMVTVKSVKMISAACP